MLDSISFLSKSRATHGNDTRHEAPHFRLTPFTATHAPNVAGRLPAATSCQIYERPAAITLSLVGSFHDRRAHAAEQTACCKSTT